VALSAGKDSAAGRKGKMVGLQLGASKESRENGGNIYSYLYDEFPVDRITQRGVSRDVAPPFLLELNDYHIFASFFLETVYQSVLFELKRTAIVVGRIHIRRALGYSFIQEAKHLLSALG
jgi:hypothetical protein